MNLPNKKRKLESFSEAKKDKEKIFKLVNYNEDQPAELKVNEDADIDNIFQDILKLINITKIVKGKIFEYKNEDTISHFVNNILELIVYLIKTKYKEKTKSLYIKNEYKIKGNNSSGKVEFVVLNRKIILYIIETKYSNLDEGRTQNMIELLSGYQQNNNNKAIYGTVTNGLLWEFTKYNKKFYKTNQYIMDIENNNIRSIRKICNIIYNIIINTLK